MALIPMRGALVEYSGQYLGPIPNLVLFQFNPESISRTLTVAAAATADNNVANRPRRETHATSAPPVESFSITAHFSAADDLGAGGASSPARLFGVGPQLAALEKMVYPPATPGGVLGAALDAVGDALGGGAPGQPVPRQQLPRILFVWGPSRVLPVRITSMTIAEKQYDALLNPIQAEVQLGLAVAPEPPESDPIGRGAFAYSRMVKDTQAAANLAKAIEFAVDLVPL
jgi:hypothetical protein